MCPAPQILDPFLACRFWALSGPVKETFPVHPWYVASSSPLTLCFPRSKSLPALYTESHSVSPDGCWVSLFMALIIKLKIRLLLFLVLNLILKSSPLYHIQQQLSTRMMRPSSVLMTACPSPSSPWLKVRVGAAATKIQGGLFSAQSSQGDATHVLVKIPAAKPSLF